MRNLTTSIATLALAGALAAPPALGFEPNPHWEEYAPEPLTIIWPEEEAVSNPPFLHWQHLDEAESYNVHLSSGAWRQEWSTSRNFVMPEEGVPHGAYTVTVEALGPDGTTLDSNEHGFLVKKVSDGLSYDLYSFTIEDRFSFPDPIIEEISNASGQQAVYLERLQDAIAEPTPARLESEDPQEPEGYEDGVWDHATWSTINRLAFQVEDYIINRVLLYNVTGEEELRDEALRIMLIAAEWDPIGSTSAWSNDHAAQSLLRGLSTGYEMLKDEMTEEDRALVRDAIHHRAVDMYAFLNPFVGKTTASGMMNDPDNNHAWFCTSALGLGALALHGEVEEADEWLAFAAQMYRGMFLCRGDRSGGFHEGIDYWPYTLLFVFQFVDALDNATSLDLYQHPWLRNTGFFKAYVHPPEGGYVPFGNCKHNPPNQFDKVMMMRLASKHNDPLYWRYVMEVDDPVMGARYLPYAVLYSGEWPEEVPEVPEQPFAVHFDEMGWVVSNNSVLDAEKQVIFAFRSGEFPGRAFGHTHADNNHFILTAGGDKLLWDAGYYDGYLTPHNRNFARMSDAHNVLMIDGKGQGVAVAGLDGKITKYELENRTLRLRGDASEPLIYGGRAAWVYRDIEYRNESELIVQDDIFLREPGRISFLLHSAHPMAFDMATHTLTITGERYRLVGEFHSEEPFTVSIRDTFPVEPGPPYDDKEKWPDQYHLTIETTEDVEHWEPRFEARWEPIAE